MHTRVYRFGPDNVRGAPWCHAPTYNPPDSLLLAISAIKTIFRYQVIKINSNERNRIGDTIVVRLISGFIS